MPSLLPNNDSVLCMNGKRLEIPRIGQANGQTHDRNGKEHRPYGAESTLPADPLRIRRVRQQVLGHLSGGAEGGAMAGSG